MIKVKEVKQHGYVEYFQGKGNLVRDNILVTDAELVLVDNYHLPILISKDKIEVDDWVYNEVSKEIYQFKENHVSYEFKILALPEHFSPQQLQDIVDGKLKEGDKILVECTINYCKDCVFNQGQELSPDCCNQSDTVIKLNSSNHITIYLVEEKMYTRKDFDEFCEWIDTWWRRGKTKKGSGWFHVGDFYKQSKPVRTRDLAKKWFE